MGLITNQRQTTEGDHKHFVAINYDLDTHQPDFTEFDMICTDNHFTDLNAIRANEI